MAKPFHEMEKVRRLAGEELRCSYFAPVLAELIARGWDTEDLRMLIQQELGECHCIDSQATQRYFPATVSDYFAIWVDDFKQTMFLKYLICQNGLLWVTSFKKDNRHD